MSDHQDRRGLLSPESSDLSDASIAVATPTPTAVPQQRHGYKRKKTNEASELLPSLFENGARDLPLNSSNQSNSLQGLGITDASRRVSIPRVPVGAKSSPNTYSSSNPNQEVVRGATATRTSPRTPDTTTPGSGRPLLSPVWQRQELRDDTYGNGLPGATYTQGDPASSPGHARQISYADAPVEPFLEDDTGRLKHHASSTAFYASLANGCAATHDIHTGRGSYLAVTLLILSIYSTVMSVLWLVTAIVQPRWGRQIYSGGTLTPSTASLLSALFAKTIELSFVTVFVGFLGQVLSRRSIAKKSTGITIAEMSMRTWVIQPGFILTHWQTLRYAGWTFLGMVSFTAALAAMFYTTASDALVTPKLRFGGWKDTSLEGLVKTPYANHAFIEKSCQTPITDDAGGYAGSTCLSIEFAGQSFYNYLAWLERWGGIKSNGSGESPNILDRPQAVAILHDNTTVQGSWVMPSTSNMTSNFEQYSRIINNVTMAMPHAGLFAAARDTKNAIMQPNELDGVGGYSIKASIPSPAVNVLCANVAKAELAPLVYTEWPKAITNAGDIPGQRMASVDWKDAIPRAGDLGKTWLNSTVVDEVFRWGEKYGRRPPVFPMFPMDYNTIVNSSVYLGDSLYILAKSWKTVNYTLCSLQSFLYPNCSTQLDVSGTAGGSSLKSHCEDPKDKQAYSISVPESPISLSKDWVNTAFLWAMSTSLNDGVLNANSSNARLLSQLVPINPSLPFLEPSIAEALAVLVGSTLLISTMFAPFVHYYQYQSPDLAGMYQTFNASVTTQQYTSGYTQSWQAIFYPVLIVVASINVICLVYFFLRSGLVTDYTEPQNLFALAMNSPPSESLSGACGAGPERSQLQVDWFVKMEEDTQHYYIQDGERWKRRRAMGTIRKNGYELSSPRDSNHSRVSSYSRLSNTRSLL